MFRLQKIRENPVFFLLILFSAFLLYVDCSADWKTKTPQLFRSTILLSGEYGRNGQADLLEIPGVNGHFSSSNSGRRKFSAHKTPLKDNIYFAFSYGEVPAEKGKKLFPVMQKGKTPLHHIINKSAPVRGSPYFL